MNIFQSILNSADRILQRFEKNENENLVKLGIVSSIGAVVMACVATHKSEKIIAETKEQASGFIEIIESEDVPEEEKKEAKKGLTKTTTTGGAKVLGYFTVVGTLEYISIKSFVKSNENYKADAAMWASLAATYFQRLVDYRQIVRGRVGAEAEEEMYYGVEKKNVPVMENGKLKKKKVRVMTEPPANKNILLFAPWTSDLYIDEDVYGCPGMNRERIRGVMKNVGMQVKYSKYRYMTNNDIAEQLQIQKAAEWQTECFIEGDEIRYKLREVYAPYEGKNVPVFYIELNSKPLTMERMKAVLPEAPDYSMEMAQAEEGVII